MAYARIAICILTSLWCMTAAPVFPADELFDTAVAGKLREQGLAHLKSRHYDAAINAFEEAASINPEAETYYYLGYAHYLKGRRSDGEDRKSALEYFERAFELDPSFSPARSRLFEPTRQPAAEPSATTGPAVPEVAAPQAPPPEQPKP